jgi:hypothetical protein
VFDADDGENMATKSLKLDSLDLDLQNPRIPVAASQRDAMQKILNEQKVKLINLAESIAQRGFSPMDRCLIIRSDENPTKFVVLEGNRRVLSAKLLKKPTLISSLDMPDAFKRKLLKAAQGFDAKLVEPVDCFEVKDRAEGNDWIRRRHQGQDSGRGIVDWSPLAKSRFSGRNPAHQALDFVLEHGGLTEDQKEQITNARFISTLDRLLSTPTVRLAIGVEINNGKLETELPPEEALKPLRRMVLDLADKNVITVTELKKVKQQEDYVAKFKVSDRANLSLKTGKLAPVEKISESDFTAKPATPKRSRAPKAPARNHIVPKNSKLNVTTPKISKIYEELRTLSLSKHVHAIGVLLRVFLEMSIDEYLEKKAGSTLTFVEPKGGRTVDKRLKDKVKEAIAHMVLNGAVEKDFKGVNTAMNDPNDAFSIDTLHAYIHNRFFTPKDAHLVTGWDNALPLFERIWP